MGHARFDPADPTYKKNDIFLKKELPYSINRIIYRLNNNETGEQHNGQQQKISNHLDREQTRQYHF
jgi:hypothetical protein